jgi:glucosamine--fructose-6-phosphate aminotransferase (isomerizing)
MGMAASHLEREIREQPQVLRRLLEAERQTVGRVARAIREADPEYVVIAARGSSDNAARYGKYLFGAANRLPVALATPSLFTRYDSPPRLEGALVLAVSQSGQSPDISAVVAEGRRQGALTVALTNDLGSPLAQASQHVIQLHAGTERSVAATKTYTASLMALAMLSVALAQDEERFEVLRSIPDRLDGVIDSVPDVVAAAERYRYMDACVVISRGYNYATAYEIALKLKELTYILAEPYSSADFRHGPLALVERGFPVLAVIPEGEMTEELIELLAQLEGRGAELVVVSALERALSLAQTPLPLPSRIPEWISPLVTVVPGQIFSLGLTLARGLDPDHPRGLRKVTLTE